MYLYKYLTISSLFQFAVGVIFCCVAFDSIFVETLRGRECENDRAKKIDNSKAIIFNEIKKSQIDDVSDLMR